ncbi:MAG: DNA repair protein RecN [Holosporales bacterium]|jgi:DNA repair protein RecN (Recombination protein N)|nr:DNA repair protein RecN [Holosporales bacterium]
MLKSVAVRDFILIDEVLLDFYCGMTVITGETGAGKSMLLSAIEFALGARIETKLIRQKCDSTSVTIEFDNIPSSVANLLNSADIDAEGNLIIRRTLSLDGKSRVFINDQVVSAKFAQSVFTDLLEVHGQRDSILSADTQLMALDRFADASLERKNLADIHTSKTQTQNELDSVDDELEQIAKEQDYIAACIKELESANPTENEEAGLLQQRLAIKNAAKLKELVLATETLCDISNFIEAQKLVARGIELHPGLKNVSEAIEAAVASVDTVLVKLEAIRCDVDLQDKSADEIEGRLMLLRDLARKHNCSIDLLPKILEGMKAKAFEITALIKKHDQIKVTLSDITCQYNELANKITIKRQEAALKLSNLVNANLSALRLAQCKFHVLVESTQKATATGNDTITFLASTNPGLPMTKLDKVASGGEAIRIMLAIKVALAEIMDIPTFIFDEIDSGTSGVAASAIGSMLNSMSKHKQVFTITHSPQVAVHAEKHLLVKKSMSDNQNITTIGYVDGQDRLEAVAKMLTMDDEVTSEACSAANTLFFARKVQADQ